MILTKKETRKLMHSHDIVYDQELNKQKQQKELVVKKYDVALKEIDKLKHELEIVRDIRDYCPKPFSISPKASSHSSEATANMIMSDFHCEERVIKETVNDLNEYDLNIAKARAVKFFQNGLRLVEIERNGVRVDYLVLALLGDFINGYLHPGDEENNELSPTQSVLFMQDILISGIEFLIKNGEFKKIYIVCKYGNHSRTGQLIKYETEYQNNFEWLMYHEIKKYFGKEKRVEFIIPISYLYYFDIYNYTIRYHHGDGVKYNGGIGGLTIPLNKAIATWNKSKTPYLDCIGHYHTFFDGGNFIANGSGIGYNNFAVKMKFSFEEPKQTFFLIDSKRGKTITCPIYLS
ncbi:MAG: hypothetical protein PHP92_04230 [Candidatus Nanoarchaeia archaeon]|nr:hypothetical protein [Candidatus Nanoarchaeia archaeon]